MTQIKIFYLRDKSAKCEESEVNKWLAEHRNEIIVRDIKIQNYCASSGNRVTYNECTEIMIVYEASDD